MDMLSLGLQYGMLDADAAGADDTQAFGAKLGLNIDAISASVAYSAVNDGTLNVVNYGTGKKTPLFTQMVYNQDALFNDNQAIVAKVAYNLGDMGKVIAAYGMMTDESAAKEDSQELDLIYKVKAGGVQYFAAYVYRTMDKNGDLGSTGVDADEENIVRVWARYNF